MNLLAQSIQRLGLTGTAAEIVAAFGQTVEAGRDATCYSLSGVAAALAGQGVSPMILVDLRSHVRTLPIGGDTLEGLLLTGGGTAGGVDFTLPGIRFQLAANQQNQGTTDAQQAILAGLLNIGIQHAPQWQVSGFDALPIESDVTAALTQISNQQAVAAFMNETLNPLLATEPTPAQIKSAVAAWSV